MACKNMLFLPGGNNNLEAAWSPCIKASPGIVELEWVAVACFC